jgi:hypothetical protein
MKFITITLIAILCVHQVSAQNIKTKGGLGRVVAKGKIVFKAYVDNNCNNKQDASEPLTDNFTVKLWEGKSYRSFEKQKEVVLDSLTNGIRDFLITSDYTISGTSYSFEKKETITTTNEKPIIQLIAIKQHCIKTTKKVTTPVTNNDASVNTMPLPMNNKFFETFTSLKNWNSNKAFQLKNKELQATINGNDETQMLKTKVSLKANDIFSVSFDFYVNDYSKTGVSFLPLLLTDDNYQKSTAVANQTNAIGFLLQSDTTFGDQTELYITPYVFSNNTATVDIKWENIIKIEKQKWYRIYFEKIDKNLGAIMAWNNVKKEWSRKIVFKPKSEIGDYSAIRITNRNDANPNSKITFRLDNISIRNPN